MGTKSTFTNSKQIQAPKDYINDYNKTVTNLGF